LFLFSCVSSWRVIPGEPCPFLYFIDVWVHALLYLRLVI
jgi:hypothetical protein